MNSKPVKTVVISVIVAVAAAVFIFLGISTYLGSRIDNFGKLSDVVEMTEEPELSAWDENADALITVSFSDVIHRIDDGIYGADLADGMELLAPKDALTIQKLSVLRLGGAEEEVSLACYSTLLDSEKNAMIDDGGVVFDGVCYGEKRPSFYTFHMMSNFLTGSLASCSCSDEALETYAVTDGNVKRIIAVNTAGRDKKCCFSVDIDRLDPFSFDIPARTVTVLEFNGETVLSYICRTDNLRE